MIALIVAYSENRAIGNAGRIPWNIPGEQKRFQQLTTGNIVIMGRKTYEEIGKPLPNRTTIVISKTKMFDAENCITCHTLSEALCICKTMIGKDIFISGGEALYREAIAFVDQMYITVVHEEYIGDTYFPEFDIEQFNTEFLQRIEGTPSYSYYTYVRKNKVT